MISCRFLLHIAEETYLGDSGNRKVKQTSGTAGNICKASLTHQHNSVILASGTHRNPPFDLGAGSSFGTAVSDPSGNEGSDTNEQLEGGGESPTVGRMGYRSEINQWPKTRTYRFQTGTLEHQHASCQPFMGSAYEVLAHQGNRYPYQQRIGPPASCPYSGMLSAGHLQE
jgi:hypothetical protein